MSSPSRRDEKASDLLHERDQLRVMAPHAGAQGTVFGLPRMDQHRVPGVPVLAQRESDELFLNRLSDGPAAFINVADYSLYVTLNPAYNRSWRGTGALEQCAPEQSARRVARLPQQLGRSITVKDQKQAGSRAGKLWSLLAAERYDAVVRLARDDVNLLMQQVGLASEVAIGHLRAPVCEVIRQHGHEQASQAEAVRAAVTKAVLTEKDSPDQDSTSDNTYLSSPSLLRSP